MVRSEMLDRMSAEEFNGWMAVGMIDAEQNPSTPTKSKQQSQAEMLTVLHKAAASGKRNGKANNKRPRAT